MQSPVPCPAPLPGGAPAAADRRRPARGRRGGPAATAALATAALAVVAAGARRRALRGGDRQIDTAHLLHSLVESDPEVGPAFGGQAQPARVLGYLVQRSIGYGLRWQRSVEDSGARCVVREAEAAAAGWSPSAATALARARERAALRGDPRVRGLDLLAALTADPDCRAVEVLRRAGVDPLVLADRIGELSQQV
ncbi:Clp protease N-terminal domain-containing protein [Streptomyces lateritius]|uniref:Clp protease N-terminal domain-containing protein n=1 Tax=Streptomyces lateritius TaxID=67313 RepID=UPI001E33C3E4|nr:Clp protease N-terminal domain-containing protein [Streptomyces lateritius]